jgi:16S rRNA C967 or C1407 C5-methylase (RsmB/RsmF family)/NOL1/NOP2/fmu family ribosome biogenesis protein
MTEDQFPRAFIKREQAYLGDQWNDFVAAHVQPSPISIRFNPKKAKSIPTADNVPWSEYGVYLPDRPSFTLDPSFHGGKFYVQEASSMFLEQAIRQSVDLSKPLNVLDLCAAPGGKSTHLLSLIGADSLLVSNEVIKSRASILSENLQKWGHCNFAVTNNDPKDFQRLPGFFDVIVVDAPCSGEGLFRKDPSASKEWSEDAVALCSKRQQRILNDVWPALKPGGILIYSTCTYNESENEANLTMLHKQYETESIALKLREEWAIEVVNKDAATGYRFFPHRLKGEGFFISVLRKADDQPAKYLRAHNSFSAPGKVLKEEISKWVCTPEDKTFIIRNDSIQFFPKNKTTEIDLLVRNLHVIVAGTYAASVKHNKLIPEHSLALSTEINADNFNTIPVSLEEALQFLRKDPLSFHNDKKGFALVTFDDVPLGWVNVLDNRLNNLYPSEWRIRMR